MGQIYFPEKGFATQGTELGEYLDAHDFPITTVVVCACGDGGISHSGFVRAVVRVFGVDVRCMVHGALFSVCGASCVTRRRGSCDDRAFGDGVYLGHNVSGLHWQAQWRAQTLGQMEFAFRQGQYFGTGWSHAGVDPGGAVAAGSVAFA